MPDYEVLACWGCQNGRECPGCQCPLCLEPQPTKPSEWMPTMSKNEPNLLHRDKLLEELSAELQRDELSGPQSRVGLANIEVAFFDEDGESLWPDGECSPSLAHALRLLSGDLWQAGDGTDIRGAHSLSVRVM